MNVGRALVRDVRDLGEEAVQLLLRLDQLRLELLHLSGDLRDLVDQLLLLVTLCGADRFGRSVLLRSQLLDPARQRSAPLVGVE